MGRQQVQLRQSVFLSLPLGIRCPSAPERHGPGLLSSILLHSGGLHAAVSWEALGSGANTSHPGTVPANGLCDTSQGPGLQVTLHPTSLYLSQVEACESAPRSQERLGRSYLLSSLQDPGVHLKASRKLSGSHGSCSLGLGKYCASCLSTFH